MLEKACATRDASNAGCRRCREERPEEEEARKLSHSSRSCRQLAANKKTKAARASHASRPVGKLPTRSPQAARMARRLRTVKRRRSGYGCASCGAALAGCVTRNRFRSAWQQRELHAAAALVAALSRKRDRTRKTAVTSGPNCACGFEPLRAADCSAAFAACRLKPASRFSEPSSPLWAAPRNYFRLASLATSDRAAGRRSRRFRASQPLIPGFRSGLAAGSGEIAPACRRRCFCPSPPVLSHLRRLWLGNLP